MFEEQQLEQTNLLLRRVALRDQPPVICLLTGSSGAGKSYLAEALETRLDSERAGVYFFDRIGVPPVERMVAEYGSGEKSQEAKTHEWIERLAAIQEKTLIVFEGQYHPRFAIEACRRLELKEFVLAVVTCNERVWEQRLRGPRSQEYLVTDDMRNWARVLRDQTVALGGAVIDTSESNLETNLSDVARLINPLLRQRG